MLLANHLNGTTKLLHARAEPSQVLDADAIVLRVARLHIGFRELFKASAVGAGVARPNVDKACIDSLSLCS